MPTDKEEQEERRQTLLNDARVARERSASTLSQFAQDDVDTPRGRFTAHERATVIGVSPPSYPPQPEISPWRHDPVGVEPPLGFSVNEMPPTGEPHEIRASIAAQDVLPSEPSIPGAQGISGGAAEDPASGLLLLTDVVEPAAPPAFPDDDEPPRAA